MKSNLNSKKHRRGNTKVRDITDETKRHQSLPANWVKRQNLSLIFSNLYHYSVFDTEMHECAAASESKTCK